ncbi:single-stranded-DNA-specific exonuclease RecJ [Candidatus Uhrbacteria bacterium]|nr:single-stranded-DNA-specific exonuclease RecJ [Candidatus Uhrbacteria bacterium]
MEKRWILAQKVDEETRNTYPHIDPFILQLLANRNISIENEGAIRAFLEPDYARDVHDPYLFDDMQRAVARIIRAIKEKEKITIYGDYDVDGVCGSTVLYEVLSLFTDRIHVHMNHREKAGYGLQMDAIKELAADETALIITNDHGISNKEQVAYAHDLGMDVIITDHHHVPEKEEDIPSAYAIIHPRVRADRYPFKHLAGAGTAFKLVQGIIRADFDSDFSEKKKNVTDDTGKPIHWEGFEKWLLDAVCMATICDCVPLIGENRLFVRYGLIVLNKTKRSGLQKLLTVANISDKKITTQTINFALGPRINAASRMTHGTIAFFLMTEKDPQRAAVLAERLDRSNVERRKATDRVVAAVEEQLREDICADKKIFVAIGDDWPLGILGLVAGKISSKYHRPVILMTRAHEGHVAGTGRSMNGFHLARVFEKLSHFFDRYGGHEAAGGFAVTDGVDCEEVKRELQRLGDEMIQDNDRIPVLSIDAEVKLSQFTWNFFEQLEKFEPFGNGNPKPLFLISDIHVLGMQGVGKENKHLRLTVQQDGIQKKLIGFSFGSWLEKIQTGSSIDVVVELDTNEWNGTKELQLKIIDLRLSKNVIPVRLRQLVDGG